MTDKKRLVRMEVLDIMALASFVASLIALFLAVQV